MLCEQVTGLSPEGVRANEPSPALIVVHMRPAYGLRGIPSGTCVGECRKLSKIARKGGRTSLATACGTVSLNMAGNVGVHVKVVGDHISRGAEGESPWIPRGKYGDIRPDVTGKPKILGGVSNPEPRAKCGLSVTSKVHSPRGGEEVINLHPIVEEVPRNPSSSEGVEGRYSAIYLKWVGEGSMRRYGVDALRRSPLVVESPAHSRAMFSGASAPQSPGLVEVLTNRIVGADTRISPVNLKCCPVQERGPQKGRGCRLGVHPPERGDAHGPRTVMVIPARGDPYQLQSTVRHTGSRQVRAPQLEGAIGVPHTSPSTDGSPLCKKENPAVRGGHDGSRAGEGYCCPRRSRGQAKARPARSDCAMVVKLTLVTYSVENRSRARVTLCHALDLGKQVPTGSIWHTCFSARCEVGANVLGYNPSCIRRFTPTIAGDIVDNHLPQCSASGGPVSSLEGPWLLSRTVVLSTGRTVTDAEVGAVLRIHFKK